MSESVSFKTKVLHDRFERATAFASCNDNGEMQMSKKSKPGDGVFAQGIKGMSPGATAPESFLTVIKHLFRGFVDLRDR